MPRDFQSLANEIMRARMAVIELRLITRIEETEGRVPSNDEVRRHGRIIVSPDGIRHYTWKGQTLFTTT